MFEILVNKKNNQKEIALLENGKLVEYYIDEEEIRKEIDMNLDLLQKIANYKPKIIRPPYGIVTKSFLKIAQKRN